MFIFLKGCEIDTGFAPAFLVLFGFIVTVSLGLYLRLKHLLLAKTRIRCWWRWGNAHPYLLRYFELHMSGVTFCFCDLICF